MKKKICNTCLEKKTTDQFYKTKTTKDKLLGKCKKCVYYYQKEYRSKNKEQCKVYSANYYQENKKLILEKRKVYRKKNKEKIEKYQRKYREKERPTER